MEEEGSDFWVLPLLLLLLLVDFTLLSTCASTGCKTKVLHAPMTIICLQFCEPRPSRLQPFKTVRWNTFFLFCTLICFLGNMMSKTIFHFRERLFFFFFQIYGDCPSSYINLVENNVSILTLMYRCCANEWLRPQSIPLLCSTYNKQNRKISAT